MNDWLLYLVLSAPILALIYVFRPFGRLFALLFMSKGLVIGPWVWGKRRGAGLPLRPQRLGKGWSVTVRAGDKLHAVSDFGMVIPPNAKALRWRYKAAVSDAMPVERPASLPLVSLVLQQKGDDWKAGPETQHYRLFSPAFRLESGEFEHVIPLEGWTNVWGHEHPVTLALADLSNVSVAFGHSAGRMHGVRGDFTFTQISLEAVL
jgi:hypothetical protein